MTTQTTTTVTTTTTTVSTPALDKVLEKAHIIFIADKSGSMHFLANYAIGGFNSFISKQKEVPGEAKVTLVLFSDVFQKVYEAMDINEVPVLDGTTYVCGGSTALYDAVGNVLSKFISTNDPSVKTIVAIMTDGEENSSREFNHTTVRNLITKAEKELEWEVMFLGANIDVAKAASQLGVSSAKFAAFAANGKGVTDAYDSIGTAATSYRSMSKAQADLNVNVGEIHAQTTKTV